MSNFVKEYRAKRKMSQDRLAEESDCELSQHQISQIERGEKIPTDEQKQALAEVLDVPVYVLFPKDGRIEDVDHGEGEEPEDVFEEEDEQLREIKASVETFAKQMEKILIKNIDKGGWKDERISFLVQRFWEEKEEVRLAIEEIDEQKLYKELIDVANFCMMICEILATRPNSRVSI